MAGGMISLSPQPFTTQTSGAAIIPEPERPRRRRPRCHERSSLGVDVVLMRVGRAGTSPRRRKVVPVGPDLADSDDVFVSLVERVRGRDRAPMLERVDPYGDLVLTSGEMPQLLAELGYLRGLATSIEERERVTRLERLAVMCMADPALELHVAGD